MIKFFRVIRQRLVTENKLSKYLIYAIGEIVLVVIGILIALQINNWNGEQKDLDRLNTYRINLITELKNDLEQLQKISTRNEKDRKTLQNYIEYYNLPEHNIDTLIKKMNLMNYDTQKFVTVTYTIEEIISTGNLSLFDEKEKHGILSIHSTHSAMNTYYDETMKDLLNYTQAVNESVDVLHLYGYSKKEHPEVANWRHDVSSKQFRLYNNEIASVLYYYDNQVRGFDIIREKTESLIAILSIKAKPKS